MSNFDISHSSDTSGSGDFEGFYGLHGTNEVLSLQGMQPVERLATPQCDCQCIMSSETEGAATAVQCTQPSVLPQPTTSKNYLSILEQYFPDVDHTYLEDCCQYCDSDTEFEHIVTSLLDAPDLPRKQTGPEHPFFDNSEPSPYKIHLAEMFPSMSLPDLERHCGSCVSDKEFNTLVSQIAESTQNKTTENSDTVIEDNNSSTETFVSARSSIDYNSTPPHPRVLEPVEVFPENIIHVIEPNVAQFDDDPSSSTKSTSHRAHPHLMALIEMFPENPIHALERHVAQFDADTSLETLADSLLSLNISKMSPDEEMRSQRLMQLSEMFPHIEVAVLEQRCANIGLGEPLDSMVEALMAEEEDAKAELNTQVPVQHYNNNLMNLANVFPDIEIDELEHICMEHEPDVSLNTLVSSVMNLHDLHDLNQHGAAALQPEEDLEQLDAYETLLNILPNADPDFLREKFESFERDDGALKRFTEDALENQNYPTYQDYTKRHQKAQIQRQYRDKFHPKNYLEEIPDPFNHFGQKTYVATKPLLDQEKAFLKTTYRDIDDETINRVYEQENFNLYKTCKQLDCYEGPLAQTRGSNDFEECYDDIVSKELLQEIAFIINEKKIRQFISYQDAAKDRALERARSRHELLECNCCCNDNVLFEDMAACSEGHLHCKTCIRMSVEVLIGNGKLVFPCLEDCGKSYSLHVLKVVLKPSVFFKMAQRQQLEEVQAANITELETCPFCDFGAIPLPSDKVFTCLNTDCMQISCRYCKEPNHIPLRCDELPERDEQVKARIQIEDRMTQALLRECYKCKKKFVKTDGCNKMTCSCGAIMCYLCRQPVKDYSHFNGQGGDAIEKCPLWSNNEELHNIAVQEAATLAKEEVLGASNNPQFVLKHDPTMVLPG